MRPHSASNQFQTRYQKRRITIAARAGTVTGRPPRGRCTARSPSRFHRPAGHRTAGRMDPLPDRSRYTGCSQCNRDFPVQRGRHCLMIRSRLAGTCTHFRTGCSQSRTGRRRSPSWPRRARMHIADAEYSALRLAWPLRRSPIDQTWLMPRRLHPEPRASAADSSRSRKAVSCDQIVACPYQFMLPSTNGCMAFPRAIFPPTL